MLCVYIYIGGGAGGAEEGLPGHEKGVETQKKCEWQIHTCTDV